MFQRKSPSHLYSFLACTFITQIEGALIYVGSLGSNGVRLSFVDYGRVIYLGIFL